MTGLLITSDHKVYTLPAFLEWELSYTGGVPCDSFCVTFLYERDMAEPLHLAAGFTALENGEVMFRGIVDEYEVSLSEKGRIATLCGRGYAARLLDNESRPVTYEAATLAEIVRCHVTPYGISSAEIAPVSADSVYTVAAGSSQWKALEGFCRTYGGFRPHFTRTGELVAAPEKNSGERRVIRDDTPILSCVLREDHYGVLTEALVIDKTRNAAYSVKNQDMIDRGGQCRRVLYTPGQSTWAAMRYTGEYQIARSKEEEWEVVICLPECFVAFPGDVIRLQLDCLGLYGDYRVAEVMNSFSAAQGARGTLLLKERE